MGSLSQKLSNAAKRLRLRKNKPLLLIDDEYEEKNARVVQLNPLGPPTGNVATKYTIYRTDGSAVSRASIPQRESKHPTIKQKTKEETLRAKVLGRWRG